MRIATLQEELPFFGTEVRIVEYRLQIALDAADRRFQLVGDVLRELAFHSALLLLARYVVDGYLVAVVEEQDAFDEEDFSVLVDGHRFPHHLPFPVGASYVLVQELVDRPKVRHLYRLLGLMDAYVGNDIHELYEEDVGQDFPALAREHGETFLGVLEVLDDFLPFHRELVLRFLLLMIEGDDIPGDVAQLVVGEDVIDRRNLVFLDVQGEISQPCDGLPDAEGESGEHEEEYQHHQYHEVDEVLVDRQDPFHVRVERQGGAVDVAAYVGRRVEIPFPRGLGGTDGEPPVAQARLADLAPVVMVVELLRAAIVEQDLPGGVDNRHPQVLMRDILKEGADRLADIRALLAFPEQLVIVIAQHAVQLISRELLLPLVLEKKEADRETQEHEEDRPKKPLAERYPAFFLVLYLYHKNRSVMNLNPRNNNRSLTESRYSCRKELFSFSAG